MEKDLFSELNISQKPALELLQKMGYTYLSPDECILQRGSLYNVLLKGVLREQLKKLNRFNYENLEREFWLANLEEAIEDFDGTLLFVSHDRYFINKFADKTIEFKDGKVTTYLGNYDDYKAKISKVILC